jgi:excinuclease ABC subunit B
MTTKPFDLVSTYKPTGDQPTAIAQMVENVSAGIPEQVLLGVTGSGKTFSIANVIAQMQKPTLVLAHNKTLAAQLFSEFREFFPNNSVQYFVSYYDYYQPEAYIPSSDTYIEKDSNINEEIEKFRHASTHALLTRKDVIIVASVSCIYGLGSPEVYRQASIPLKKGDSIPRHQLARRLTDVQYARNDIDLKRGTFRMQGDTTVIFPAYDDFQIRVEQFGDVIESISLHEPLTGSRLQYLDEVEIYPAKNYLAPGDQTDILAAMQSDLEKEVDAMQQAGKLLEAQRLKQRVTFDLEMIRETGTCSGIENYSRYFDRRAPGTSPSVLLDYFPDDYLLVIDESHITVPQIRGMYNGDRARKTTLVDYGFRLKAALDNRPLMFSEFLERQGQTIYVSATPAPYELDRAATITQETRITSGKQPNLLAEQLIRPTGIPDPEITIRSVQGQIDDLIEEIAKTVVKGERVLVTTLTKRMAEDITEFLSDRGIKTQYLHSDVKTIERTQILQELRLGTYDVLVGINLLREGLDLPEVSLVGILDADKEGFLRSETALVQTIGRAARHPHGRVILYADRMTGSIERAVRETGRRREKQIAYNTEHGIIPTATTRSMGPQLPTKEDEDNKATEQQFKRMSRDQQQYFLDELREEMRQAALSLNFEAAANVRDQIAEYSALLGKK